MSEPELWRLTEAADFLGVKPASARKKLHRLGVASVARETGRGGENLYRADEVRAVPARSPGRGTRTDLRKEEER